MKTTVEIPDKLYRQLKSTAAANGQTIKAFLVDAVQDKLSRDRAPRQEAAGWRAVFGKANKKDMEAFQKVIDEEFSRIDPEGWS